MGKCKSSVIILFCLTITIITFGSEPNDCNEVHSYGYGYESDYNKDCRVDANDLDEITAHWMVYYGPEPPNLPGLKTYEEEVMDDGPALYLRFEDFNDPCDNSGNDYWVEYGSNTNVGPEGGGFGNCIYFGGGAGSYAAAANQETEPNPPGDINVAFGHEYGFTPGDTTWEFWYRGRDIPELPTNAVFLNQNWEGNEPDLFNSPIFEMVDCQVPGFRCISFPFNRPGSGGDPYRYCWAVVIEPEAWIPLDDAWHHIVFSLEEMYADANRLYFRLVIDGETVKSIGYPDTSPVPGLVGGDRGEMDHIVIGAGGWRDAQADDSTLIGYIDEFAIYSGILPMDRVVTHYEAGLPRTCEELWDRGWVWTEAPWAVAIDRNQDCHIDLYDFADFALEWALCNDPQGGPGCVPNW